jgi:hypothetical protein
MAVLELHARAPKLDAPVGSSRQSARMTRRPVIEHAAFLVIAIMALVVGLLVYMADRVAAPPLLLPAFARLDTGALFGGVGQWLPSFVHPFAFGLLTAAVLPPRSAWRYGACAAWGVVNVAFEVGQHPSISPHLAAALHDAFGSSPPARALANYFVLGTFDRADVVAAVLGALAAAALLRIVAHFLGDRHAH